MKLKIRKGDNVFILAGKDKGKTGIVKAVLTNTNKINKGNKVSKKNKVNEENKVIVSGVQVVKCFNKKKIMAGGSEFKEMPINISNVAHLDPKDSKPTKVRVEIKDNKKFLVSKRSGEVIRVVKDYNKEEKNA